MMAPRPTSPVLNSVCGGRESSVSPPSVVAPLPIKPNPLSEVQAMTLSTDQQQQRLLYQLALAERLRLASAGLAWARPPLLTPPQHPHPPHLQEPSAGSFMGLGFPMIGGLATFGGGMISASQMPPGAAYPPSHPLYGYRLLDPRMLLPRGPEEPKPQHSYIGLIAMAILSSPDKKLILSDIYQYILDNYPYFRSRGTGWRNSIRHNLSLNDCFVKSGRSANGKGHYWAIHPANIDDFRRGDFRRRRAQRRVRKHMGLAVDDDSEPETLSPPPQHTPTCHDIPALSTLPRLPATEVSKHLTRPKRQFDVLSLLAPDCPRSISSITSDHLSEDPSSMEVTSTGGLAENPHLHPHLSLGQDAHLKVIGDLRLQVEETGDDTFVKFPCLLAPSESNKSPPGRSRVDEDDDDDEREEKCVPIYHGGKTASSVSSSSSGCSSSSSTSTLASSVGGGGGGGGGLLEQGHFLHASTKREASSPTFLSSPWHSPSSPSKTAPNTPSEVYLSNPIKPGSPQPQHYPRELVTSNLLRTFPANLMQANHLAKPVQNLPGSSLALSFQNQSPNLNLVPSSSSQHNLNLPCSSSLSLSQQNTLPTNSNFLMSISRINANVTPDN